MKSDKIPHIINADIKSSIKKIDKRKLKKMIKITMKIL